MSPIRFRAIGLSDNALGFLDIYVYHSLTLGSPSSRTVILRGPIETKQVEAYSLAVKMLKPGTFRKDYTI